MFFVSLKNVSSHFDTFCTGIKSSDREAAWIRSGGWSCFSAQPKRSFGDELRSSLRTPKLQWFSKFEVILWRKSEKSKQISSTRNSNVEIRNFGRGVNSQLWKPSFFATNSRNSTNSEVDKNLEKFAEKKIPRCAALQRHQSSAWRWALPRCSKTLDVRTSVRKRFRGLRTTQDSEQDSVSVSMFFFCCCCCTKNMFLQKIGHL